jgi:ABC-type transport system involved in multi-copper enzyme maturation permease subunit
MLSLVLIISLFAASGFVFTARYRQQSQDYWKETNKNLSGLMECSKELYKLAFYEQKIRRKPKSLTFCVGGFERYLPNYFNADIFSIDLRELKSRSNFLLTQFSDIDWVFIISMLLSFIVLLFTYDSFCGEKQAGTLRLILSGAIPRHQVLLGKYFGAMFTLGIPLFIGLLISLFIVFSSGIVEMVALDWLKIIVIVGLSLIYLSIFLLLGMLVSSRTTHPASSIVILLLVWVGLVILVPSLGRIISDIYYKAPSITELRKKIVESIQQTNHEMEAGKYGKNADRFHPNLNNPINNPQAAARYWTAFSASINRVHEQHHNQLLNQAFAGRNFACVSPSVIYQRASETIAGTGINRCASLYQQIKRYQEKLKEFIRSKDAEDPDSLHLIFDAGEWMAANWVTISKRPVNFDTVPKFQERDLVIGESLKLAICDIGLLVLFNLVLFSASFVSFLRYDVR